MCLQHVPTKSSMLLTISLLLMELQNSCTFYLCFFMIFLFLHWIVLIHQLCLQTLMFCLYFNPLYLRDFLVNFFNLTYSTFLFLNFSMILLQDFCVYFQFLCHILQCSTNFFLMFISILFKLIHLFYICLLSFHLSFL